MRDAFYYRRIVDDTLSRLRYISKDIEDRKKKKKREDEKLFVIENSQQFVQTVALNTQKLIKYKIESVVQKAIDLCFPGEYAFEFDFQVNRDKTEVSFLFVKDGELESVKDEAGGGLKNVLSFVFREILLSMSNNRNVIFLDEPFAALSMDLQPLVGQLIQGFSKELGIQFILSTHNKEMMSISDRTFNISSKKRGEFFEACVEVL